VRIALLSMDYPPRMAGGTTIHTRALALALLEAGHEVHVVAARAEGASDEEDREGVQVHRVGRPYTTWSALTTGRLLGGLDVVHGHGTCAYGHLRLHEFPTIVKMHSTWAAEAERYRADHLICITEAVARETETAYGVSRGRMTVVHNGVDVEAFRRAAGLRDARRQELGLEGVWVAYVGRLEPHKGVGLLVEAAQDLGAGLLLVGDGSERARLERRARELGVPAVFTGFVDHAKVPGLYAAADIVCHPSLYEPLGNVVLEAMAAGRPIVAARSGGLGEVFEPGTGALVEPGHAGVLREALRALVEDEGARERAGRRGLETAPRYGWDRVAEATARVCERVLADRR
jgi:glycogen(starch) synthase